MDQNSKWFYKLKGAEIGPLDKSEVLALIKNKTITAKASVKEEGSESYTPIIDSAFSICFFRNPSRLTKWLKIFLYLSLTTSVLCSIYASISLLQISKGDFTSAIKSYQFHNGIRNFYVLFQFIQYILFLIWIYKANYNSRRLGAQGMEFLPGWAVAWTFIPIVQLYKPYQAIREIWKTSINPENWKPQKSSVLLLIFWISLLTSNVLLNILARMPEKQITIISDINPEMIYSLIMNAVDFIAIPLLLIIIHRIYTNQMKHYNNKIADML